MKTRNIADTSGIMRPYFIIPLSGLCGALFCLIGVYLLSSPLTTDELFKSVPKETMIHLNKVLPWTQDADVRIIGQHMVLYSVDVDCPALAIVPLEESYFPLIYVSHSDSGSDIYWDIVDVEGRQLSLVDRGSDGTLNTLTLAVGHDENKVVLSDRNFSGSFDLRLGPQGTNYFMKNDQWWPFIVSGDKMYIESDQGRREVVIENGTLTFVEPGRR